MKTHLYTILQHCLQVFSAACATAEYSPMQECTRTVSWVRRIMLCFFPRDLRGERELRWSYSWTKQWSVAQRESGEQRVTCMGPLYWYPSERRGEQTKHTSVALTIMPSSSCIHGAHISSSEGNWARENTEAMMVFWSSSKVVISAAKCRRVKTSKQTRQDNQVLWPPVYKITSNTATRHAARPVDMKTWSCEAINGGNIVVWYLHDITTMEMKLWEKFS